MSQVELCVDDELEALDAFLVERLYEFNAEATGFNDARLLGGCLKNESAEIVGAFNGHTWGSCCVIAHLWVHQPYRGRGIGRALLRAAESEAAIRGCEHVVLSTHSFQSPEFYQRAGYEKQAVIADWPKGHTEIFYRKRLSQVSEL